MTEARIDKQEEEILSAEAEIESLHQEAVALQAEAEAENAFVDAIAAAEAAAAGAPLDTASGTAYGASTDGTDNMVE